MTPTGIQIDSSLINKAYETLKDPLKRSKYLLQLKTDLDWADGKSIPQSAVSQDLLMFVWEIQDCIQDASADNDLNLLDKLTKENRERMLKSEERLAKMFQDEDYEGAKSETISLNYWKTIERMLNEY